jgi:hypothetical protein
MSDENSEDMGDNSIETSEEEAPIPPPPEKNKGKQNKSNVPVRKIVVPQKPAQPKSEPIENIPTESEPVSPIIADIAANSDLMATLKANAGDFQKSQEFKSVEFQYKEACRLIALNEKFKAEMEDMGEPTPEEKIRWGTYQSYQREIDDWTKKKFELQGKVALKLIGTNIPIPQ